jgi:hypothetical protein
LERLLNYDSQTGLKEVFHYDEDSHTASIVTTQDVETILDMTEIRRNDTDYTKKGMKREWLHHSYLPDSIILMLKVKHGLNIFNKDHIKACFRKIEEEYPKLKTTNMKHKPKG